MRRSHRAAVATVVAIVGTLGMTAPAVATFPGDDGTILYGRLDGGGLYTIEADGSNGTVISEPSPDHRIAWSTWSPDGSRIAFIKYRGRLSALKSMAADGTDVVMVWRRFSWLSGVTWSPNGKRLAFCGAAHGGTIKLFVIPATGGHRPRELSRIMDDHCNPTWSPDGSEILFTGGGIRAIRPDGSHLRRILPNAQEPDWSPDGSHIVFARYRDGDYDLFVMDRNGEGLTNLTHTPRRAEFDPVFSPSGTRIVYARSQSSWSGDFDDLWIMDADGSSRQQLTRTADMDEYFPSWRPV